MVRTDDEVTEGANDAKRSDVNRVVCDGIDGENKGVESVMFKWDNKVFSGVPFGIFVELVLHGEPERAVRVNGEHDEEEDYLHHIPQPLVCEFGVWDKRETWFRGARTRE